MNFKKIAFLGDSFTWGEGLELYIDNAKWKSQRKNPSSWSNLLPIQDADSEKFRNENRFSTLVANHFNSEIVIDSQNGGNFRSLLNQLKPIFDSKTTPEVVIIQFSVFSRNNIHFHLEKDVLCHCDMCKVEHEFNTHITFDYINQIVAKRLNIYENGKCELTPNELLILHSLEMQFNINQYYSNITHIFDYLKRIEYYYSNIHLDFLLKKYVNELERRNSYVFFIDSWDTDSSYSIFSNTTIVDNLIPLLGYDGNYYKNYVNWEHTFPHRRIQHEYPHTENGHPTLLQHEYISNSIIEFLEKKQLKKKINYI